MLVYTPTKCKVFPSSCEFQVSEKRALKYFALDSVDRDIKNFLPSIVSNRTVRSQSSFLELFGFVCGLEGDLSRRDEWPSAICVFCAKLNALVFTRTQCNMTTCVGLCLHWCKRADNDCVTLEGSPLQLKPHLGSARGCTPKKVLSAVQHTT